MPSAALLDSSPKILAIDAGFASLGWSVIGLHPERDLPLDYGTILTVKTAAKRGVRVADDDAERCQRITQGLSRLIDDWSPVGAVVELPCGGAKGARSARAMGLATGVIVAVLTLRHTPAEWVTPMMVKRAASGDGAATKEEVQVGVDRELGPIPWDRFKVSELEHVADSLAAFLAIRDGLLYRMAKELGRKQSCSG